MNEVYSLAKIVELIRAEEFDCFEVVETKRKGEKIYRFKHLPKTDFSHHNTPSFQFQSTDFTEPALLHFVANLENYFACFVGFSIIQIKKHSKINNNTR